MACPSYTLSMSHQKPWPSHQNDKHKKLTVCVPRIGCEIEGALRIAASRLLLIDGAYVIMHDVERHPVTLHMRKTKTRITTTQIEKVTHIL